MTARPLSAKGAEAQLGQLIVTKPIAPLSPLPTFDECVLLRELNHRIGNEFTSAICVISVQAGRSENTAVKQALNDVVELLHQYADVHQALKMPAKEMLVDAADYLQRLCVSITRSKLTPLAVHFTFASDSLLLQSGRCWRLGLIVNELLTNVARHAQFEEEGAGEVKVELKDVGTFVRCKVSDNGFAPEIVRRGRGLTIIDVLAESLGGRIHVSTAKRSSFLLAFPLTEHERRAGYATRQVASSAAQSISQRLPG